MSSLRRTADLPHYRARKLRREQTDAEARLWHALRAGRLEGQHFRRQLPVGNFIADFCCHEKFLIIEVDGGQHADQAERDRTRSRWLQGRGYRVLRFWDNDVLTNLEGVLEVIREALA